jgi:hypothetical protein
VLDGLEREMGAFANPEHYQVDSEEQDRRNEKEEVQFEETGSTVVGLDEVYIPGRPRTG